MKIEHTLGANHREYAKAAISNLDQATVDYYVHLGRAYEAAQRKAAMEQALGQVLGLVEKAEKLPASPGGYRLSPDGTKLVGETAADSPVFSMDHGKEEGVVNGLPS